MVIVSSVPFDGLWEEVSVTATSERDREGGMTVWAGRLLGGALVALLVAGALVLSPDGARLRRLSGSRGAGGVSAAAVAAGPETRPSAVPVSAAGRRLPVLGEGDPEREGTPRDGSSGSFGWIATEVMGTSRDVAIYLDGVLKGTAPILLEEVECGFRMLTFATSDSVSWDEQVRVTAGDTTVVAFSPVYSTVRGVPSSDSTPAP